MNQNTLTDIPKKRTYQKIVCPSLFAMLVCNEHKCVISFILIDGPGGNRTRVQTGIPCTSTIIVHSLTFPLPDGNEHPAGFSSFMIRPYTQSLIYVVSYIIDAWVLMCRCTRSDSSH